MVLNIGCPLGSIGKLKTKTDDPKDSDLIVQEWDRGGNIF